MMNHYIIASYSILVLLGIYAVSKHYFILCRTGVQVTVSTNKTVGIVLCFYFNDTNHSIVKSYG